jgi:hypothetical protein
MVYHEKNIRAGEVFAHLRSRGLKGESVFPRLHISFRAAAVAASEFPVSAHPSGRTAAHLRSLKISASTFEVIFHIDQGE